MAITSCAAIPPGHVPGHVVPGIFSLKPDDGRGTRSVPVRRDAGPMCDRCWLSNGFILPVTSYYCPHREPR